MQLHLENSKNLKNILPSNSYRNFGNFGNSPDTQESVIFPKFLGESVLWDIPQVSSHLGIFLILKIYQP